MLNLQSYKNILDNIPDGCQIVGPDWRYLYANRVAAVQGHIVGKTMMDVYSGFEKTKLFSGLKKSFQKNIPVSSEDKLVGSDGRIKWLEFIARPVPEGLLILSRDITRRKRIEERLIKSRSALKKRAERRLGDFYKHLGKVNRKISVILELEKYAKTKRKKREMADYILNSAARLSSTTFGLLYVLKNNDQYRLLSSYGRKADLHGLIPRQSSELIKKLEEEKQMISSPSERYEKNGAEPLIGRKKLTHLVVLPLLKEEMLKGFVYLESGRLARLDTQDLEFLEVFAIHAANALDRAGVLK